MAKHEKVYKLIGIIQEKAKNAMSKNKAVLRGLDVQVEGKYV